MFFSGLFFLYPTDFLFAEKELGDDPEIRCFSEHFYRNSGTEAETKKSIFPLFLLDM